MSRIEIDWEALAPYWEYFEDSGLEHALIGYLEPAVAPPLLFVGGGRGVFPARLAGRCGRDRIVVIDRSPAMARRAAREQDLVCAVADVVALPFVDRRFASIVCATGVLETMSREQRRCALSELARTLAPGGHALIAALCGGADMGSDAHRDLDRSYRDERHDPDGQLSRALVAIARDMGRPAAYELLKRSMPRFAQGIAPAELQAAAGDAGLRIAADAMHGLIGLWKLVSAG